jgi:hypothetical protein
MIAKEVIGGRRKISYIFLERKNDGRGFARGGEGKGFLSVFWGHFSIGYSKMARKH